MKSIETNIPGVKIVVPEVHGDDRGFFKETIHPQKLAKIGINHHFVQMNHSKSQVGTLRGLHFQLPPYGQSKFVRVLVGKIFDVAVGGVRDKKISISDLIDVSKGLNTAVRTGNKEFAEKAVANNNALKKLGLDVVIGDISDSYDDPTRLAGKPIERFAGKKKKFSPVYGAKVVLSL